MIKNRLLHESLIKNYKDINHEGDQNINKFALNILLTHIQGGDNSIINNLFNENENCSMPFPNKEYYSILFKKKSNKETSFIIGKKDIINSLKL